MHNGKKVRTNSSAQHNCYNHQTTFFSQNNVKLHFDPVTICAKERFVIQQKITTLQYFKIITWIRQVGNKEKKNKHNMIRNMTATREKINFLDLTDKCYNRKLVHLTIKDDKRSAKWHPKHTLSCKTTPKITLNCYLYLQTI